MLAPSELEKRAVDSLDQMNGSSFLDNRATDNLHDFKLVPRLKVVTPCLGR
jgi:hypothetical protein